MNLPVAPPNLNPVTAGLRRETQETVQQLRQALAALGITLPSLDVDVMSYVNITGKPLIELGRCDQDTARALAAALRKEADR